MDEIIELKTICYKLLQTAYTAVKLCTQTQNMTRFEPHHEWHYTVLA